MRYISVGIMVYVEDDLAANHEALYAHLESTLLSEIIGSILTIEDATEAVQGRLARKNVS